MNALYVDASYAGTGLAGIAVVFHGKVIASAVVVAESSNEGEMKAMLRGVREAQQFPGNSVVRCDSLGVCRTVRRLRGLQRRRHGKGAANSLRRRAKGSTRELIVAELLDHPEISIEYVQRRAVHVAHEEARRVLRPHVPRG